MRSRATPSAAGFPASILVALIVLLSSMPEGLADQASIGPSRILSDVTALEGSTEGGVVVALHRGEVAIFNATTLAPITTFYPPSGQPTSIGLSPSGRMLAIGLNNSSVLLYNTSTLAIEAWGLIATSYSEEIGALRWSPDGSMVAVRATDGKLRVLDSSLALVVNFSQQSEGPIEWARINGTFAVVSQGRIGADGITLWNLNGSIEYLAGQFYSSYGDATWTMWPDGRFMAVQAPLEILDARLFASSDFGRNPSVVSHAGEYGDWGVAANWWTGEFATFGGSSRITFWRQNATPFAELPIQDPCPVQQVGRRGDCVGAFAWIAPDSAVAWNKLHAQLFRVDLQRSDPTFGVTIEHPAEGTTVTGDFTVGGRCTVIEGGSVWVRADGLPWQKLTCKGVWYAPLNATYWRPGNHTLFAALYNGTAFSQWATLQVFRPTDANSTADQPTVLWNNPNNRLGGGGFYDPRHDLRAGGYTSNTGDGRLLAIWFRVDGAPWQEMIFADGSWSHPFDSVTLSRGDHTFDALGWDGVAFSEIASMTIFFNVEPGQVQTSTTIDSPTPESVLSLASVFKGQWSVRNAGNGSGSPNTGGVWVDVSIGGGPWLKLGDSNVGAGTWNFTLPSPYALSSTLTFCVRASTSARLGNPTCANYYAPALAVDLPPSVSITNASGRVTSAGAHSIAAGGMATDDYGVVALLFRVDGGDWIVGGRGDLWTFIWEGAPNATGNHTVEAVAYDGFHYSPVAHRDVHIDLSAPPVEEPKPTGENPGTTLASFLVETSLAWILVAITIGAAAMYWVALRRRRPGPPDLE